MIQLTKTEALFIEEVLQEMLYSLENKEFVESTQEIEQALEIIRACNVYSEEEMLQLEEEYTEEELLDAEYPDNQ